MKVTKVGTFTRDADGTVTLKDWEIGGRGKPITLDELERLAAAAAPRETPQQDRAAPPRRLTISMPHGATCPRCWHPSKGHSLACFVQVAARYKGRQGETVTPICGCGVWQGPRPWLGEGPAWAP